jgi:dTMP kinase
VSPLLRLSGRSGSPGRLRYTPAVTSHDARQRGWFVTLEGPDGAGKTTQARRLRDQAVEAGFEVVLTREPGGTPVGEQIRDLLLDSDRHRGITRLDARTDALLFNAARRQLVAEVIRPAIDRATLVISTRFADSTLAYQGYGGRLPLDELRAMEHFATDGLKPDLTVLLDVPVEVGLARKSGAEVNRFESDYDVEFHRRVRDGFLALAADEPDRFVVVDASQSPDEVAAAVLAAAGRIPGLAPAPGFRRGGEPRRPSERIHP